MNCETCGDLERDCGEFHCPQRKRHALNTRHTIELLYCRLEMMAKDMKAVSEMMRYVGGFNERMIQHAKELEGAANIARMWIEEIKEEKKQ